MILLPALLLAIVGVTKLAEAIQPQARDPVPQQEIRELVWGDLNFLSVIPSPLPSFSYTFELS